MKKIDFINEIQERKVILDVNGEEISKINASYDYLKGKSLEESVFELAVAELVDQICDGKLQGADVHELVDNVVRTVCSDTKEKVNETLDSVNYSKKGTLTQKLYDVFEENVIDGEIITKEDLSKYFKNAGIEIDPRSFSQTYIPLNEWFKHNKIDRKIASPSQGYYVIGTKEQIEKAEDEKLSLILASKKPKEKTNNRFVYDTITEGQENIDDIRINTVDFMDRLSKEINIDTHTATAFLNYLNRWFKYHKIDIKIRKITKERYHFGTKENYKKAKQTVGEKGRENKKHHLPNAVGETKIVKNMSLTQFKELLNGKQKKLFNALYMQRGERITFKTLNKDLSLSDDNMDLFSLRAKINKICREKEADYIILKDEESLFILPEKVKDEKVIVLAGIEFKYSEEYNYIKIDGEISESFSNENIISILKNGKVIDSHNITQTLKSLQTYFSKQYPHIIISKKKDKIHFRNAKTESI